MTSQDYVTPLIGLAVAYRIMGKTRSRKRRSYKRTRLKRPMVM